MSMRPEKVNGGPDSLHSQGWGQDFSPIGAVTHMGHEWAQGKDLVGLAVTGVVTAALTVAASILSAAAQAACFTVKSAGFVVNAALWIIPGGFGRWISIHPELTPGELVLHAYKTAASVAFAVVGSVISLGSPFGAYQLAQAMGLAPVDITEEATGWAVYQEKMAKGYGVRAVASKLYWTGAFLVDTGKEGLVRAKERIWSDRSVKERILEAVGVVSFLYVAAVAVNRYQTGSFSVMQPAVSLKDRALIPFTWTTTQLDAAYHAVKRNVLAAKTKLIG